MDSGSPIGNKQKEGGLWTGLIIIIIGVCLLADRLFSGMGVSPPHWLIKWPTAVIVIGILSGIKHKFHNFTWAILIFIGGIFMLNEIIPDFGLDQYAWPICIIGAGMILIVGASLGRNWRGQRKIDLSQVPGGTERPSFRDIPVSDENYFETTSVFGGVSKRLFTNNFRGGHIINFMGGVEIDLSHSDISAPCILSVTQIFGGVKLIIPPHWTVISEIIMIFGGIDDKRDIIAAAPDKDKLLLLKGTTIFGGVEIRSY